MTYIEFFDRRAAADNVCACFANPPERVILLGDHKLMQVHARRYSEIFAERGDSVEFIVKKINESTLPSIVDALAEIADTYDDCVFDLTGGTELYHVAVGILRERYPEKKLRMRYCRVEQGKIIEFDSLEERVVKPTDFHIGVSENIRIYGGCIVSASARKHGTDGWDLNDEFCRDIDKMWDNCKLNANAWNKQLAVIAVIGQKAVEAGNSLTVTAPTRAVDAELGAEDSQKCYSRHIMERLRSDGLISQYSFDRENLTVTFKNHQVKRALLKSGRVLELYMYINALDTVDKDGRAVYHDVMTGVCIDWDGVIDTEHATYDTENEIDVIMMHGAVPVFMSCKNGRIEKEEVYKLSTVAERFGGRYVKKVLVATDLDVEQSFGRHFKQRADDMGIQVISNLKHMSREELQRILRTLWENK